MAKEKKNPHRHSVSYNKKSKVQVDRYILFTQLRCHMKADGTVCWPWLLLHTLSRECVCLCVYFVCRGDSAVAHEVLRQVHCVWCSAASAAGQGPDGGFMMPGAEMTCFCHWVCAPSREALNYIGTVLTDMFVIQSVLKIPSKGYYLFDKPLHSICACMCVCGSVPAFSALSTLFYFEIRCFTSAVYLLFKLHLIKKKHIK